MTSKKINKKSRILETAREVISIEARTISRLSKNLGKTFEQTVREMANCEGRVIVTGMGKPGFIARKIAATLASTGTPSLYLHPAEAAHGDFGMITSKDILIAISNSGETDEIIRLLPALKKKDIRLIAMTSSPNSTLAKNADLVLDLGVSREACPLNLAPSASTTASLAMGDALALSLLSQKGFQVEHFAELHPGGSLGKKLLKVRDIMRKGKSNPTTLGDVPVRQVLLKITEARAGSCSVIDSKGRLAGIFTDGDLRRHLKVHGAEVLNFAVEKFATKNPLSVDENKLAAEAMRLLQSKNIDELPVVDARNHVVGLLDIQDLLRAGLF